MGKKVNFSLKEIRVQSFVTALGDEEKEAINVKGGAGVTWATPDDNCYSFPWFCCTAPEPSTCS